MAEKLEQGTDRRTFVKQAGVAVLAVSMDARSYARVVGANGRIRIGQLGCGDQRQNSDTCVAAVVYPKGFLYTYKTTFGNSYRSFTRIQGRDGTITCNGCEGGFLYTVTKEGGRNEFDEGSLPNYTNMPIVPSPQEGEEVVRVPGAPSPSSWGPDDDDVRHMMNWVTAMQTRKQPNATVDHGISHSVVCIMAAQSYWSGKRLYWNQQTEEIVEQPAV